MSIATSSISPAMCSAPSPKLVESRHPAADAAAVSLDFNGIPCTLQLANEAIRPLARRSRRHLRTRLADDRATAPLRRRREARVIWTMAGKQMNCPAAIAGRSGGRRTRSWPTSHREQRRSPPARIRSPISRWPRRSGNGTQRPDHASVTTGPRVYFDLVAGSTPAIGPTSILTIASCVRNSATSHRPSRRQA